MKEMKCSIQDLYAQFSKAFLYIQVLTKLRVKKFNSNYFLEEHLLFKLKIPKIAHKKKYLNTNNQ